MQQANPPYAVPPSTSPPMGAQLQHPEPLKAHMMEIENVSDYRSQREHSVLSGMSIEDMEAAETLKSLHKGFDSPQTQQAPPTHVQTTTIYNEDQPEPLLSLVTSQYPLAGAVINSSLTAYKTTQSYIPGAEWTERHVGLPIAGKVARISGVEGGLRWALQPKKDARTANRVPRTPDIERGPIEIGLPPPNRRSSEVSFVEPLPVYNASDRSPPYEQRMSHPGWRQQLVISTSGLGIAMSEESLRSLRYCLSWLRWANGRLGGAIQSLKDLVEQFNLDQPNGANQSAPLPTVSSSQNGTDGREAVLSAKITALKAEVLQTLKQVVSVVSTYAGGALPENARNLVHRHLTSLPQRFSIASANNHDQPESGNNATNSANRVMVLAQEGLDMMTQVSRVVNDTLISAESWCEKLGRRPRQGSDQQPPRFHELEKSDDRQRSATLDRQSAGDTDVKMEL